MTTTPHKEKMCLRCGGTGVTTAVGGTNPIPCPACSTEKEKREDAGKEGGEWEKEFDDRFCTDLVCDSCYENPCGYHTTGCRGTADSKIMVLHGRKQEVVEEIKSFIRTLLSRTRKEATEEAWREAWVEAVSADCFGPERTDSHCCNCVCAAIKKSAKERGVNIEV